MPVLTVTARVLGQKSAPASEFTVPLPPELADPPTPTLRELLAFLVEREVAAFHERQEARRLAVVLSPDDIAAGAARGKIDSGERDLGQRVDPVAAVATAIQSFEDGFYYVFLDDAQVEMLDAPLSVAANSRLLFVRLTPLAGG
jgi:hypothetical protein